MSYFSLRTKILRTTGGIQQLKPGIQALKSSIEKQLEKSSDCVFFNENNLDKGESYNDTEKEDKKREFMPGVTDISFEKVQNKHERVHRVSIYFASSKNGIRAYREMASKTRNLEGVEYKFTPQFGQSRISFQWEEFWQHVNKNALPVLPLYQSLQLGKGKETS